MDLAAGTQCVALRFGGTGVSSFGSRRRAADMIL